MEERLMVEKVLKAIADFFILEEDEEETQDKEVVESKEQERTDKPIELSEVIEFIRELESYYTNDIFKEKSEYIDSVLSEPEIIFFQKKIKGYEIAMKSIVDIKEKLLEKERGFRELWGKATYSFYNELEKQKLKETLEESYEIVSQINAINVIPELDSIIQKRIETYQKSWNIISNNIPRNTSLRIISRIGNIETYQFGQYQKQIIDSQNYHELLPEQINAIKDSSIKLKFKQPTKSGIWIHCATIERNKLEYVKRTTIFTNDWEEAMANQIVYDIVEYQNIEYYIKSILQLLLPRKTYVIMSIINPNEEIYRKIEHAIEKDELNRKVKIINKQAFLLPERTGEYGDNLQFVYISRKQQIKEIVFRPFTEFINNFINL